MRLKVPRRKGRLEEMQWFELDLTVQVVNCLVGRVPFRRHQRRRRMVETFGNDRDHAAREA
jgi:hypothetical protein